ncbi:MAG TPA: hypothetical protein VNV85_03445 [Puia sp.]|jgi:hypothetical protein|nr:hypothetical protein [Puia sp.]
MANYGKKLQALKGRREDTLTKSFSLSENFDKMQYGESATYAMEAMEPIAESYTKNTYVVCGKLQNQLKTGLSQNGIDVEFRYQGSVPTNTHIKNYSDIDLLTIHGHFFTLEAPQEPQFPYAGDPVEDLKKLRTKSFRILDTVYSGCKIDDSGSKCINISGGSINRKIDIIFSNWYNSLDYKQYPIETNKGVQILDRDKNQRILNFPFLHIHWINEKDGRVAGNEKRMIRLLKSLRADAETEIKVSSYDIASLVYRMDDSSLLVSKSQRLALLQNTNVFLLKVINDTSFRNSLYVANGTRQIFSADGCNLAELVKLHGELQDLILTITTEIRPLFKSVESSNVYY